jgi:predicted nicotinamide N-methyase
LLARLRRARSLSGVSALEERTDLVEEVVGLGDRELRVLRPRRSEDLLDEQAFEHEEFLPYWAELWPSGVALARDLAARALRGARTLELGCGLALPSIAAAQAGGRVVATDWSRDAIALAGANAERAGADIETLVCDWSRPEPLLERAPWDLVLAADVLYERRNVDALVDLLPRLVDGRGEILLADPGRPNAERFLAVAEERFERRTTTHGRVSIHRLRRSGGGRPAGAGRPSRPRARRPGPSS